MNASETHSTRPPLLSKYWLHPFALIVALGLKQNSKQQLDRPIIHADDATA
jgi:hypothetical protein